jgi:hypothetical protein
MSDDLDPAELDQVQEHLKSCLTCYREYQTHLKARRFLKELVQKPDLHPVMEGFTDEVMEQVTRGSGGPAAPVPRVIYAYLPRALAAAALILVLVTAGFYVFRGEPEITDPAGVADRTGIENAAPESRPVMNPVPFDPRWVAEDSSTHPDLKKKDPEAEDPFSDLEPLPQQFPAVQPVNMKRNF